MFFDESQSEFEQLPQGDMLSDAIIRKWVIAKGKAYINLNTPIFKILPVERFTELMLGRTIAFTNPTMWEDPAEYSFVARYQELSNIPVEKAADWDFYGQCWSMNGSCDGLWRTYTNNKTKLAVQIGTTVGKIINAYVRKGQDVLSNLFCGKVVYENREQLKRRIKDARPSSFESDLDSVFRKREDFKYEQEVRFVMQVCDRSLKLFENKKSLRKDKYALFHFSDLKWIDGCVVSPWASPMEEAIVKELARVGGVKLANVRKSKLYEAL